MRRRSAHIQIIDGSAVVGPAGHRPKKEKLLERKLALKNVALRKSKFALQIKRRKYLAMQNYAFYVRRIFRDGIYNVVAERFFLLVPSAFRKLVGSVLHEARQHMFARRRDGRIGQAGNNHID